jgi:hypothetical protein
MLPIVVEGEIQSLPPLPSTSEMYGCSTADNYVNCMSSAPLQSLAVIWIWFRVVSSHSKLGSLVPIALRRRTHVSPLFPVWMKGLQRTDPPSECNSFTETATSTSTTNRVEEKEGNKLTVVQLCKKLPAFYETRRFITMYTTARHWSLSLASWI